MSKFSGVGLLLLLAAPLKADSLIFDNIGPNGGIQYGIPATSQLNHTFEFDAGVADDFIPPTSGDPSGDWFVKRLTWTGMFTTGAPNPDMFFNVIVWPQDSGGAFPAGGAPAGMPPDYTVALAHYSHIPATSTPDDGGTNNFSYSAEFPVPFLASDNVNYWLEIQADINYPPLWGWQIVNNNQGEGSYKGFAGLLDEIQFWTSNGPDCAFQLHGDPVPEPACATLMLAGGLLAIRARRQA